MNRSFICAFVLFMMSWFVYWEVSNHFIQTINANVPNDRYCSSNWAINITDNTLMSKWLMWKNNNCGTSSTYVNVSAWGQVSTYNDWRYTVNSDSLNGFSSSFDNELTQSQLKFQQDLANYQKQIDDEIAKLNRELNSYSSYTKPSTIKALPKTNTRSIPIKTTTTVKSSISSSWLYARKPVDFKHWNIDKDDHCNYNRPWTTYNNESKMCLCPSWREFWQGYGCWTVKGGSKQTATNKVATTSNTTRIGTTPTKVSSAKHNKNEYILQWEQLWKRMSNTITGNRLSFIFHNILWTRDWTAFPWDQDTSNSIKKKYDSMSDKSRMKNIMKGYTDVFFYIPFSER